MVRSEGIGEEPIGPRSSLTAATDARLQALLYEPSKAISIFPVACVLAVLAVVPFSHWTHPSLVALFSVAAIGTCQAL